MMLINLKIRAKQSLYANEMANFQLESLIPEKTFSLASRAQHSTQNLKAFNLFSNWDFYCHAEKEFSHHFELIKIYRRQCANSTADFIFRFSSTRLMLAPKSFFNVDQAIWWKSFEFLKLNWVEKIWNGNKSAIIKES